MAPNSSGVLAITKKRPIFSVSAIFGSLMAFTVSPCRRVIASRGVPAGASMPYQNGSVLWVETLQARHAWKLLDVRIAGHDAEQREEYRVTIGRGPGHFRGADVSCGAGLVLDDHRAADGGG